ncbi:MAG: hypothetical protein VW779_08000, partial [Halieaceae bacterium]
MKALKTRVGIENESTADGELRRRLIEERASSRSGSLKISLTLRFQKNRGLKNPCFTSQDFSNPSSKKSVPCKTEPYK